MHCLPPSQVCLRQVDMELLCQLWTINEQITELRKRFNANNGDEDEDDDRDDMLAAKGTPGMPLLPESVEEMMEQEGGVAVFDGEEEFRMRNGGERSVEGKSDLEHVQNNGRGIRRRENNIVPYDGGCRRDASYLSASRPE